MKRKGYKGILEVGYANGVGVYKYNRFRMNVINGYQFNPYFSMGFGTGIRYYFGSGAAILPLFSDFRAYIINKLATPHLALGAGYSANLTNGFKGEGFILDPSLGIKISIKRSLGMHIGFGYELQQFQINHLGNTRFINSSALCFDMGL